MKIDESALILPVSDGLDDVELAGVGAGHGSRHCSV